MAKIPKDPKERKAALDSATAQVIQAWAMLEVALMMLLTVLLNNDQFKTRIDWLSMPNGRARLDLIRRLGETYLDESVLEEFRSILKACKNLARNRNALAHNPGILDANANFYYMQDAETEDEGIRFHDPETVQLSAILDWPGLIHALNVRVLTFTHGKVDGSNHLSKKIHASPRTQR